MAKIDQSVSPVLDALEEFHARDYATFAPPGHKQGKGADEAVRRLLGAEVFRGDILATGGLDDRKSSGKVLEQAQVLMADAVGAEAGHHPCRQVLLDTRWRSVTSGWIRSATGRSSR